MEARQQLDSAFDDVATAVDGGMQPTEAVIKIAKARRFGPGQGEILGRLFNTGQTTVQLFSSDDPAEKIAGCELVDNEKVRAALESQKVATTYAATPVSSEYDLPPLAVIQKRAEAIMAEFVAPEIHRKAAYWHRNAAPDPIAPAPAVDTSLNAAVRTVAELQHKAAKASEYVSGICKEAGAAVEKFLDFMGRVDSPSQSFIKKTSIESFDPKVANMMDRLKPFFANPEGHDELTAEIPLDTRGLSERQAQGYKLAQAAAWAQHDAIEALELQEALETQLAEKIAGTLRQPGQVCIGDDPFDDINGLNKQAFLGSAMAGMFGAGAGRTAVNSQSGPDPNRIRAYLHQLDNPSHAQRLNAIHARTGVEQLMATDPVLSGYHPDDVTEAYNSLVSAAPRGANQQLWLQSMMRRMLAQGGALDPDDVGTNVIGTEKALMDNQNPRLYQQTAPPPGFPSAPKGPMDRLQGGIDAAWGQQFGGPAQPAADQATTEMGTPA